MTWEIRFEKRAQKELDKIPVKHQKRILTVLPAIADNPFIGKKLDGELTGLYSYSVWPYRIIYRVYKKLLLIIIVRIGHRQGVYRK